MMKQPYLIPRRSFLQGAGVAMSLPLLEIMSPAIAAAKSKAASDNLRFCVLYKGWGVNPSSWDIAGGSETEFQLSKLLSPLETHKKDITILSGIDSDHRANGTHVAATLAFMTGDVKKSNFKQSQSFDQAIADEGDAVFHIATTRDPKGAERSIRRRSADLAEEDTPMEDEDPLKA